MAEIDTDAERAKSDEWLTRRDHYLLWRAAAEYLDTIDRLRARVASLEEQMEPGFLVKMVDETGNAEDHTMGPWQVRQFTNREGKLGSLCVTDGGRVLPSLVCTIEMGNSEAAANAALIALAPSLLRENRELRGEVDELREQLEAQHWDSLSESEKDEAIRKAADD